MLITEDSQEFKDRYAKLRPECSVALDAMEQAWESIEDWPMNLRRDALERMGLESVVAYRIKGT